MTGLSAVSLLAALITLPLAVPALAQSSSKTVVLVHGAWANGSSWSKVIPLLEEAGLNVVAVHNPLSSLAADITNTARVIADQPGPVVLVGHSYGGAVITAAGGAENVAALVYVAAFVPEVGQSINAIVEPFPTPEYFPSIHADAAGFTTWPRDAMAKWFAPDLPADELALVAATQAPFFIGSFAETVDVAAYTSKPSWFVVPQDDQIIPAALQEHFVEAIGAKEVSVKSGHLPMLSQPKAVADAIIAAAAAI